MSRLAESLSPTDFQFGGSTIIPSRDAKRLGNQLTAVRKFVLDGNWHTLEAISLAVGAPQASVSARLRDCRRLGLTVERKHVKNGLHLYRVINSSRKSD